MLLAGSSYVNELLKTDCDDSAFRFWVADVMYGAIDENAGAFVRLNVCGISAMLLLIATITNVPVDVF
jgi:hypothetical protein